MTIGPVGFPGLTPAAQGVTPTPGGPPANAPKPDAAFGSLVDHLLGDANAQQLQADQAVRQLATGQTDSIHDVMLAIARADLSFRLVLEIRNRLTEAYQEVMRMQV